MNALSDVKTLASWHNHAAPWTTTVREQQIASWRPVTDRAIIEALLSVVPKPVPDIGCGRSVSNQSSNTVGSNVVLIAPEEAREIVAHWIEHQDVLHAQDLEPTSWRFAPLETRGPVIFDGPSGKQALARSVRLDHFHQRTDHDDGTAARAIDLSH